MGFFYQQQKVTRSKNAIDGISIELLHRCECKACPLRFHHAQLRNPDMKPYGAVHPRAYFLGEAPGKNEDIQGRAFVGKAGQMLRSKLEDDWLPQIRWNNCVRTRPPENRDPTIIEMEACRPSVIRDIVASKPKAIFGFGAIPLKWTLNQPLISLWRGRRAPVNIGGHRCWFFPMYHPQYINYQKDGKDGRDLEFAFALDLKNAWRDIDKLPEPVIHTKEQALENIRIIWNSEEAVTAIESMWGENIVGFDYETNRLRPFQEGAKILSAAISGRHEAFAFPLDHPKNEWHPEEKKWVRGVLERFLHDAPCRKVAHHLTFEQEWSAHEFGIECLHKSKWGCSESQAYIIDERSNKLGGGRSLDFLCVQNFGLSIKGVTGNLDRLNLEKTPLDKVLTYNALDSKYHRLLFLHQREELKRLGLEKVYEYQIHRAPSMVLSQLTGVPTDPKVTKALHKKYSGQLAAIEKEIAADPWTKKFKRFTSKDYRPSAIKDATTLCSRFLKVTLPKMDEENLRDVDNSLIKLTLRWRKVKKLLSTYVDPLMPGSPHLFPDGRLHPITLITSTNTWRTSSEDPNIQNWPSRDKIAKEVRRQVPAPPGYKIVAFDYAGIQARNVAMESKDPSLVKAFWNEYDIHADWRDRILKEYPKWIPRDLWKDKDTLAKHRHIAKNGFVFPSLFGARIGKLCRTLGMPEEPVQRIIDQFGAEFPLVWKWHERLMKQYQRKGYVEGLTGFRRRAPISPNQLINAPIQADEALIVCEAMYRLSKTNDDYLQAMLEVHDDLTFLLPTKKIDNYIELIATEMTKPAFEWINVPIVVEVKVGDNWGELEPIPEPLSSVDLWGHMELKGYKS